MFVEKYYKNPYTNEVFPWEKQTLEVNGVKFVANVVPMFGSVGSLPPRVSVLDTNGSYLRSWKQTNFWAWDIDVLEVHHPLLGLITKSQLNKPIKLPNQKGMLKRLKWILKSFDCNGLVLEAEIGKGFFKRKIYKLI